MKYLLFTIIIALLLTTAFFIGKNVGMKEREFSFSGIDSTGIIVPISDIKKQTKIVSDQVNKLDYESIVKQLNEANKNDRKKIYLDLIQKINQAVISDACSSYGIEGYERQKVLHNTLLQRKKYHVSFSKSLWKEEQISSNLVTMTYTAADRSKDFCKEFSDNLCLLADVIPAYEELHAALLLKAEKKIIKEEEKELLDNFCSDLFNPIAQEIAANLLAQGYFTDLKMTFRDSHTRNTIAELATVKDRIQKTYQFAKTYADGYEPYESSKIIIRVDAQVKAGLDLAEGVDIEMNREQKTITLIFPQPRILSVEPRFQIHENNDAFFDFLSFKPDLKPIGVAQDSLVSLVKIDAINNNILNAAKDKMEPTIRALLVPLTNNGFSVIIRYAGDETKKIIG